MTHYIVLMGEPEGSYEAFIKNLKQLPQKVYIREIKMFEIDTPTTNEKFVDMILDGHFKPLKLWRHKLFYNLIGIIFKIFWFFSEKQLINLKIYYPYVWNTRGFAIKVKQNISEGHKKFGEMY